MAKNDQAKPDADRAPKDDEAAGLIRMTKAGETLAVHPTAVEAHRKLGWKVAQ